MAASTRPTRRSLIERFDLDPIAPVQGATRRATSRRSGSSSRSSTPELLILDEPTSGPRPARPADVLRGHPRGGRPTARTVFLSSHVLSEVEKTCDRVAIIRDGRLVKVDRVDALRDLAHHQVELRFAGPVPPTDVRAARRASATCRRRSRPAPAGDRADHAGRPGRRALRAARLRAAASRASRRRSWPSTATTARRRSSTAATASRVMTAGQRRPARHLPAHPAAPPPLRLRQHLWQDDPRFAARLHHRRRPARRAVARAGRRHRDASSRRRRPASRSTSSSAACPRRWSTCSGSQAGQAGHAGRLHELEVRRHLHARDGAVVDPRAVRDARRRGTPRQPRLRRRRRRSASAGSRSRSWPRTSRCCGWRWPSSRP